MKYLHLVWAALFRRKTRTIFTLISVLAAFLLFGLLDSVHSAFSGAANTVVGVDRLVTISKVSSSPCRCRRACCRASRRFRT